MSTAGTEIPERRFAWAHTPLARAAFGLAFGFVGGSICKWIGTPIPFVLGSIFTVGVANILGWRVGCPKGGRQAGQIVIGIGIGLYFTPEIARVVLHQLPWMAGVGVLSVFMGLFGAFCQMRIAGLDSATAFFGSIPGGMSEMIAFADKLGADGGHLTVSQVTRVTIVVFTVPAALIILGEGHSAPFHPITRDIDWGWLALLILCAGAVSFGLNRVGMTNAWMLGACIFASLLTVNEISWSGLPSPLATLAQLLIGTTLGARFQRETVLRAPKVILAACVSSVVLVAIAGAVAMFISYMTGVPATSMFAATSPGGLAEMSITAQVLHLAVPVVTGYHVIRVLTIALIARPLYRVSLPMLHKVGGAKAHRA